MIRTCAFLPGDLVLLNPLKSTCSARQVLVLVLRSRPNSLDITVAQYDVLLSCGTRVDTFPFYVGDDYDVFRPVKMV